MNENKTSPNIKKRLIIVFIIIVGILLLMYLLTLIIPKIYQSFAPKESEIIADFSFYPADYNENIFDDEEYVALIADGFIEYDNGVNSIVAIDKENAAEQGEPVQLITNMLYSIINGDSEEYNSYFSDRYFESHDPKGEFTMQKVYDARITFFSSEKVEDKTGAYTKYIYKLNYYIYENNGTFRKDIGDESRTQYVVICERDNKLQIDNIMYNKTMIIPSKDNQ